MKIKLFDIQTRGNTTALSFVIKDSLSHNLVIEKKINIADEIKSENEEKKAVTGEFQVFLNNYDKSSTCNLTIKEDDSICYKKYLRLPIVKKIDVSTDVKKIPDNFKVQYKEIVEHAKQLLEV